jgi:hypothetical protein
MALFTSRGVFTTNNSGTTNATQTITLNWQPKALIMWATPQTTEGVAANQSISYGFSDGTTHRCMTMFSTDAAGTSNAGKTYRSKIVSFNIAATSGVPTVAKEASVAFISTGFTLTWTTNNASAYIVHYIALGGEDITNASVNEHSMATSISTVSYTTVGFQPDAVFYLGNNATAADTATAGGVFGYGVATKGATVTPLMFAHAQNVVNGTSCTSTMACKKVRDTGAAFWGLTTAGAADWAATIPTDGTGFHSTGFKLTWSDAAASANKFATLSIKGAQWNIGTSNKPTATSAAQTFSTSFYPSVLFVASTGDIAATTALSANADMSLGAGTASGNAGCVWSSTKDATLTNSKDAITNATNDVLRLYTVSTSPTLTSSAVFTSFSASNAIITWGSTNSATAAPIEFWIAGPNDTDKQNTDNAVIQVTQSQNNTANVYIQDLASKANTDNAVVQVTQSQVHTANTYIQDLASKSHTANVYIQDLASKSHTANVYIQDLVSKSHTANVYIQDLVSKSHTANAVIQVTQSQANTDNAVVQVTQSQANTDNAVVQVTQSQNHTANVYVQDLASKAHTANVYIQDLASKAHTANVYVQDLASKAHTANAIVQVTQSQNHTANAIMLHDPDLVNTDNTIVQVTQSQAHTANVYIQDLASKSHTANTYVQVFYKANSPGLGILDMGGFLTSIMPAGKNVDVDKQNTDNAVVQVTQSQAHTANTYIQDLVTKNYTANVYVQDLVSKNNTDNAVVQVTQSQVHTANVYVQDLVSKNHTANALVQVTQSPNHTANTYVQVFYKANSPGLGILDMGGFLTSIMPAGKNVDVDKQNTDNAVVQVTQSQNNTDNAIVQVTQSQAHTANVYVQDLASKANADNAVVQVTQSQAHTANVYVSLTYKANSPGLGILDMGGFLTSIMPAGKNVAVTDQNNTDNAVVQVTQSQNNTDNAVVQVTQSQNHTVNVYIQDLVSKANTDNAIVQVTQSKSHTANVYVSLTYKANSPGLGILDMGGFLTSIMPAGKSFYDC